MKRKLMVRVTNDTRWNTTDLRRLFAKGLRSMEVKTPRNVYVRYRRDLNPHSTWVGGRAWLNSSRIEIYLPRPERVDGRLDITDLAQTWVHEVQHTQGFRHRDMVCSSKLRVPWSAGMGVRLDPPKEQRAAAKPSIDSKVGHAEKMLKRAATRLKRAKTLHDKWFRKVRYYQLQRKRKEANE